MEKFFSCDWGTSSFRLRLVETTGAKVIAEENSDHGIAKVFELWKQAGQSEESRLSFYLGTIRQSMQSLGKELNSSLDGFPLVISGMACSTLGMIDLPYKQLPSSADGSDLLTRIINADNFKHDIVIISGARTETDAMRGEETQLAGCSRHEHGEQLFIFPGTHSKHVTVKNGKMVDIKTYMTGEFFELLCAKSILSAGVKKTIDLNDEKNKKAFEAGVIESRHSNLLHGSFKVRTNYLFDKLSQQENYYYLSGLLIGTEMKEITGIDYGITLVSDAYLRSLYKTAFNLLVDNDDGLTIQSAEEAMVAGQLKILNRLFKQKHFSGVL